MKNKFIVLGVALGLMFTALTPQVAIATEAEEPSYSGGIRFRNPSFIGIKRGIIMRTIAPTVIDGNDQGLLYAICRQSEIAGDYALAWDYYTALSPLHDYIGMSTNAEEIANFSSVLSPYVYSSGAITGYRAPAQWGCWVPPWPARYEAGLIGMQNSANGYSLYYFRTDDGQNPN